jgi:hypothetical protein
MVINLVGYIVSLFYNMIIKNLIVIIFFYNNKKGIGFLFVKSFFF